MNPETRTGVPYDPSAGRVPEPLQADLSQPGAASALLLIPTGEARSSGWAAQAAAGIATGLARAGRRVVLADLSLEEPELHAHLDVPNQEGVADLFVFGASIDRVVQGVPGRPFEFMPVGAYVPDARELLAHPRWNRVMADFETADAALLLYLPPSVPGFHTVAERAGRAIVLGGADAQAGRMADALPHDCELLAVLTAAPAAAAASAAASGTEASEAAVPSGPDPEETAAAIAGTPDRGAAQPPGPEADENARIELSGDVEASAPEPVGERKKGSIMASVLRILLITALAVAAYFAYQWYLEQQAAAPADRTGAAQPAAPGALASNPPPVPAAEPAGVEAVEVPVSVAIEAHTDVAVAQRRIEALRSDEPGLEFFLAPATVNGQTYYRLMAGPVRTEEQGTALMRRLVDAGHKTAMESWAVQQTPWAFALGSHVDRAAAVRRREALQARGVPAYVVAVPHTDRATEYRVYAGAYENAAAADVLMKILDDAGVSAELVRRTGSSVG